MRNLLYCVCALLCLSFTVTAAYAEGFALYEYSARGIALGGATVARKPDPSAIAYNPALMTRLDGIQIQAGVSAITPAGSMSGHTTRGQEFSVDLKPSTWLVPHAYYTQKITDRVSVGVGEFSRFGLGFEYPHNWPGRFNVYEVDFKTASINPNIAVAVTDELSLAAGVEFIHVNLDIKRRANVPLPASPLPMEVDSSIVNADDIGIGVNLAAHYQFNDNWAAGLSYRSQAKVHAKGEVDYSFVNKSQFGPRGDMVEAVAFSPNFHDGNASGKVVLPDSVAGGISWTPLENFSVEAGAIWTRWSTFQSLNISLPDDRMSKSKKHWDDSWRFNVGVEYAPIDWLALRAGYVYDRSPMTETYEDYLIPTDGRHIYSAGVGVNWDNWTVDLAYAYIDAKGRDYSARFADGVLDSKTKKSKTDIISLSVGYEF